jgi:RHS repeat-associated protein
MPVACSPQYFQSATQTLAVNAGENLVAYVYLDPSNMPSEVMVQWCDNTTGWEHRAYWGANNIAWGTSGTVSRKYLGNLPAGGQWVRLEVPASAVGLAGRTVNGLALTLYGGRASLDRVGKAAVGGPQWLVADQLGTPRMIADKTGSLPGIKRHDYLPFGEELGAGVGGRTTGQGYSVADGVRQKLSGKERDSESGLDFFASRYYSAAMGRFTSPDSFGGRVVNPQTLNLYAYVRNNPLKYIDPTGHVAQDAKKPDKNAHINELPKPKEVVTVKIVEFGDIVDPSKTPTSGSTTGQRVGQFIDAVVTSFSPITAFERTLPQSVQETWHSPDVQIPLAMSMAGSPIAAEVQAEEAEVEMEAAIEGDIDALLEESLYHYTNEEGLTGILNDMAINPSTKAINPADVRYGDGQYLSDIVPGTKTPAQLSREFIGNPFQGQKYTHFIELDVRGLNAVQGRPGVFVIRNESPLNITGRVLSSGEAPTP